MTTADTEARTALQELLDERQRYQGWLRALEQRRTATPVHVYERVHTDYTLRLDRVMQRLRERAEQLLATIDGMQSRLQSLRSREADRTDERNEYELRAAVGELTPDEWERRRGDADRELTGIAEDRRLIETELAELQRIVAMTREAPPEPAPAPAPEPVAAPSPWSAPPASTSSPAAAGDARSGTPDISSFAPTPAAERRPAAPAERAQEEGPPSTANEHPLAGTSDSPSIDDFVAEWPLRQMGSEGTAAGAAPESPSTAPATASWHPPARDGAANASGAGSTNASSSASSVGETRATDSEPQHHHLGDGRRDMDKTLKCPECGAMNYATEWYCERCGGELASF